MSGLDVVVLDFFNRYGAALDEIAERGCSKPGSVLCRCSACMAQWALNPPWGMK